jgi:hypothetical protein
MIALRQICLRKSIVTLQLTRIIFLICALIILQSSPVRAQWTTNGNDVYKTNTSGNVGIGVTNPGAQAKFEVNGDGAPDYAIFSDWLNSTLRIGRSGTTLQLKTDGSQNLALMPGGNVGIGTSSPTAKLHVYGSGNMAGIVQSTTAGAELDLVSSAGGAGSWGLGTGWATAGLRNLYLYDNVAGATRMIFDSSGNVGIGTTSSASYKLDVNGGINAANINSTGNITAAGSIAAKYQDVAEWVPASHVLPAGTVVTLDPTKSNHVEASTHAYDTRVAGVVSEQPGITLGEQSESKVLVATTGRVKVMVDSASGPIRVGDLLVTSDIPGVAKKSEPLLLGGVPIHRPGTLIGKALESLAKGRGEILVLLSLQ